MACLLSPRLQDSTFADPEGDLRERPADFEGEAEDISGTQKPQTNTGVDTHFNDSTETIERNGEIPCYGPTNPLGAMAAPLFPPSAAINMPDGAEYDNAMFLESDGDNLSGEVVTETSQFGFNTMPFGGLTQDWLNFDPFGSMDDFHTILPSNAAAGIALPHHTAWSIPSSGHIQPPISRDQPLQTVVPSATMPTTIPVKTASSNVQSLSQPWPFEHSHDAIPSTLRLPPLRDMLRGGGRAHSLGNTTMDAVAQLLSGPLVPSVEELSHDLNATAAFYLLRRSVDAFFSHFCAILPIVHVATWDMFSTPTALIAAMACIGSIFVDSSDAWENSLLLSEICSCMIVWLVGLRSKNSPFMYLLGRFGPQSFCDQQVKF